MTREEKAIIYFKDIRKRLCEDYLNICPKDSVAHKATLAEKDFYDTAIQALEQEPCDDAIKYFNTIYELSQTLGVSYDFVNEKIKEQEILMALKALPQEPCTDTISRQNAIDALENYHIDTTDIDSDTEDSIKFGMATALNIIQQLPPVTPAEKVGQCRDCKWWKDSDGVYRRGIHAESQCPINHEEVYKGSGYCFRYEPKMQEVK